MPDLTDFGGGVEEEPPVVERKYILQSPHTGKIAGFLCEDLTRGGTVYTVRRFPDTLYGKAQGYPISDAILSHVDRVGASRILIHEGSDDTASVYEFKAHDYLHGGHAVPDEDVEGDDSQTVVPLEDRLNIWENHAGSLHKRDFHEACERIDWRGYDPDLKERKQGEDVR